LDWILVHVANGIYEVSNDEQHELFKLPEFVNKMMENKWLGSKTNQGFYKEGKDILTLDLDTLEYRAAKRFLTLELTKTIDKPINRFKVLVKEKTKQENSTEKFLWNVCLCFEPYSEISDELYKIDDAMKAGFGWENGPSEIWDAIGVEKKLKS
jgi:3-hydroxyacyl-CoA dehydrogenase